MALVKWHLVLAFFPAVVVLVTEEVVVRAAGVLYLAAIVAHALVQLRRDHVRRGDPRTSGARPPRFTQREKLLDFLTKHPVIFATVLAALIAVAPLIQFLQTGRAVMLFLFALAVSMGFGVGFLLAKNASEVRR